LRGHNGGNPLHLSIQALPHLSFTGRGNGQKQFETFKPHSSCTNMRSLVYIIVVVLIISWLLGGFAFHIGGDAIHIIIVIAIILLLFNLFGNHSDSYRRRWW
jgi:hypothetical protein